MDWSDLKTLALSLRWGWHGNLSSWEWLFPGWKPAPGAAGFAIYAHAGITL